MPKKANTRYSEESLSDLASIFEYIAEDSPARALDYIDKLSNAITNLQENPNIGVTCKRKLIRIDCRVEWRLLKQNSVNYIEDLN